MLRRRAYIKIFALILILVTLFTGAAFGQSPSTPSDSQQKEGAVTQGTRQSNSIHGGHDWLGADGSDHIRFLTIVYAEGVSES